MTAKPSGAGNGEDWVTVERYFTPTEAHIIRACLAAAGVPAAVADDHIAQMHSLLTVAVGGVRVMVPVSCLQQAHEALAALQRGEYQLGDDVDVGTP